jgi:transcription initiation factor TFIIIB Brf1 subunit/transcription initiation factor TFIIB
MKSHERCPNCHSIYFTTLNGEHVCTECGFVWTVTK